jgi:alcohol dehydrogenase
MRAVAIDKHGDIDELNLRPNYPDPRPAAGEVVLKVKACALNYHDLFTLRGMPGIKIDMPVVLGIDLAGDIVEIGSGVSGWKVGDRVLIHPIIMEKPGLIGETRDGGLAEYVAVPSYQLLTLPAGLSYEDAAALPCAYGTAHRMMLTRGAVKAGERVLILGASGGVGTCCVQLAHMMGAEIVACASSPKKLERLAALGAKHVVDYSKDDFMQRIHDLYGKPRVRGGGGVDVVVNFTGGDTWVRSIRCLTKGGRLLTCGATAGFDPKEDIRYIWTFEQNIMGSNGWSMDDIKELVGLIQARRLKPIVDDVLPLAEAREAFRRLRDREVFGKILVRP